jgi:RNA polymerase sigma-70 factor (ECF subfamily)
MRHEAGLGGGVTVRLERSAPYPEIDRYMSSGGHDGMSPPFSLVTGDDRGADAAEGPTDEDRFRSLFERRYQAIHRYAVRRMAASPADVLDVTAQVFAVAWRRLDRVPEAPHDLPWLYGVARKLVSRQQRTLQRRQRLADRLTAEALVSATEPAPPDPDGERVRVAIGRLRSKDQEVLRLVLWEGLSHADAGEVLHCSANAIALRLYKARQRLRSELTSASVPTSDPGSPSAVFPQEEP